VVAGGADAVVAVAVAGVVVTLAGVTVATGAVTGFAAAGFTATAGTVGGVTAAAGTVGGVTAAAGTVATTTCAVGAVTAGGCAVDTGTTGVATAAGAADWCTCRCRCRWAVSATKSGASGVADVVATVTPRGAGVSSARARPANAADTAHSPAIRAANRRSVRNHLQIAAARWADGGLERANGSATTWSRAASVTGTAGDQVSPTAPIAPRLLLNLVPLIALHTERGRRPSPGGVITHHRRRRFGVRCRPVNPYENH
jgi:hypothetical protein